MKGKTASKRFTFFLCLSMVVLGLLPLGYFGRVGIAVRRTSSTGNTPAFKNTEFLLDGGRFACWIETGTSPAGPDSVEGRSLRWMRWRPRLPDIKHAVLGFDSHPLPVTGASLFLFAFPLWCVALPFVVAPVIYFRRRIKNVREPAGFAVIAS